MQSSLQSVLLPLAEIEVMEKQSNIWEQEKTSARGMLDHILKDKTLSVWWSGLWNFTTKTMMDFALLSLPSAVQTAS
jgi:hypothetical protein